MLFAVFYSCCMLSLVKIKADKCVQAQMFMDPKRNHKIQTI